MSSRPKSVTRPSGKRPSMPAKESPSYFQSVRKANAEALPLVASSKSDVIKTVVDWLEDHAKKMAQLARLGPGASDEKETVPKVRMLTLLSFATKQEVRLMLGGMVLATVSGLSMPAWLLLLAKSLETFNSIGVLVSTIGSEATMDLLLSQLYQLCWLFGAVGGVSLIVGSGYVAIWTYTGEKQALRIREKFVRASFKQEAAWFDKRGDPQELPAYASNALVKINGAIGRQMMDTYGNLLSAVCCLAVAIGLNAPLALIMLCVLPIVAVAIAIISIFMRRRSGLALEMFASAGAFASEVISAIKTVSSLNAESWAAKKYEIMVRQGQRHSILSGFLARVASGVMGLLFYATYTIAFLLGSEQVANTEAVGESKINPFYCIINYCGVSGSEVMVCIYGVILCAQFFALMTPGIQAVNLGRIAAVEIFGAIKRTPEIDASSNDSGVVMENYDGSLEFKNVTFAYPSRPESILFNGFNLRIAPGSSVALVGPSGSGKSTISKLLLRFYDPIAGRVEANGTPLTDLNLKWWRSQIGYVQQAPSLFPGTIRDNIAMGKNGGVDVPDDEIVAAAKAASAHDFIMDLPERYDTFYNGASMQLSGGQVQRIAIARALVRNPSILILDEATSALDASSEKSVQQALAGLRKVKKITTVTVAHRLSTIISSDQIAVIADGSIQQLGSHKSLIEQGGIYGLLCKSQGISAESQIGVSAEETAPAEEASGVEKGSHMALGNENDLEAAKVDGGEPEDEKVASFFRLWQQNKDEWAYLLLGLVGAICVGALPPCEGILFARLTANFFELDSETMKEENRPLCFYFLALGGVSLLGNAALGCGFSVSGFRLSRRMRVLVFDKIVRHSVAWFDFPENSTGELTTRLEEDAEMVSKVTGWSLGQQVQVLSSMISGLIISMVFSWQIGLIALACMPLIVGSGFIQAACTRNKVIEQDGVSSATILEQGLREISLVQAYGFEELVGDQYCNALVPDSQSKVKQGIYAGLVFGISQCAVFGTFGLLFYAGVEFMLQAKVGFTEFFASLLAIMFSAIAIGQVSADFGSNHKGLAAAARLFAIVDAPLDEDDPLSQNGSKPDAFSGGINFRSVHFSYPTRPGHPIYYPSEGHDGFNLAISPAQSVAFVGRSGSGKSTALQLLLRFYRSSSGFVSVDHHDVKELNLAWLRSKIGYVGQMPVLFSGTIRENLLMGKRNATEEEIVQAARMANAHDFISSLSSGYDTEIGPGGSLLSGGQKQRIAIARAIIKNPPVLVLDEATSALDNESERVVQAALDDMREKHPRTTLVVAHRLVTVKNCDKIAVLEHGGIVEYGKHDELLAKKGIYYDLWRKQGVSDT